MNVVDSSGWIEFFLAGANGPKFKPVIEQRNTLLVPVIALFEVHKVLSRKVPADAVTQCLDVMRLGRVLDITDRRAVAAASVAVKHRLAMADAMMYSLALELGATFWTQDVDYQGLPGVNFFAKP
ncbi:type II toxin-antitoxin system VapC family toxin [Rhodoferax sp.]|jgi:predicted nucleic acid-binding protein|uniref:type II toxin-antitoxin system VapC family toxin n=1 Tax=Rhodoferax sp. TaxID=50421 RepID=UPI002726D009|nr:type II toxin-antitoxin system VapC family toxin [Rhodoferax sp.]MDO9142991.1 type II toxin-antitoxin system VapC family toxin [Rhodoferax sp.]MDP1530175.1 type II toxin-antitoxin system VapC family toxin [Rhodoferax sp.]MDP1945423.1 type II toxin-antitoxin system VapC family toxin [Rhodoferax sp.]MDP2443191.1 type II toxin-antitoxin system VapC family toxin [Rhodoferax sp.]MDP3190854.1 type II toxin-antitoxin system VapC family toxin [Rhodoferax sp.]